MLCLFSPGSTFLSADSKANDRLVTICHRQKPEHAPSGVRRNEPSLLCHPDIQPHRREQDRRRLKARALALIRTSRTTAKPKPFPGADPNDRAGQGHAEERRPGPSVHWRLGSVNRMASCLLPRVRKRRFRGLHRRTPPPGGGPRAPRLVCDGGLLHGYPRRARRSRQPLPLESTASPALLTQFDFRAALLCAGDGAEKAGVVRRSGA
jgi:hypothetical protein